MARSDIRSFVAFLQQLDQGRAATEISAALREIVGKLHEVEAGGKTRGKMTLDFRFVLDRGVIVADWDMKVTHPKEQRGLSIFYTTPDNNLTHQDPRQADLALRDVSSGDEVRSGGSTALTVRAG